jgi:hypothetical protein
MRQSALVKIIRQKRVDKTAQSGLQLSAFGIIYQEDFMPTINQLIRKERKKVVTRKKTPALQ